ncbi:hypothetical protein BMS84_09260, partial [Leuconostoc pseudomesenteroides]
PYLYNCTTRLRYKMTDTTLADVNALKLWNMSELDQINHWINARPMKTLNWQSPRKVFQQFAVFG